MLESDEQLLRRCADGESAAWAALVDRYAGLVRSIPREMGLPAEVCDDVTQLVFASLVRQIKHISAADGLAGWFSVVSRRESWRAWKRRRIATQREAGFDENIAAPEPASHSPELDEAVRSAVEQLGQPCRELIQLLFFSDPPLGYEDVARRLGMAMGSIGPTRRRCLARLTQNLAPLFDQRG